MHEVHRTRRISYANVTATLALVMVMSTGGAFAAAKIGSGDIAKNAVKSKHIANGAVKTKDLAANSVTGAQIVDGSVKGADVGDSSLTGTDIQDGTVGSGDVQDGSLGSNDIAARAKGVALAGVGTAGGTTITKSFNRLGGAVTMTNPSVGTYEVTIPGAAFSGFTNQISSIDGSYNNYCYVNTNVGASTLQIRCRTFTDTLVDTAFNFVLFSDNTGVARPAGTPSSADGR
jgi:hypothetical protein